MKHWFFMACSHPVSSSSIGIVSKAVALKNMQDRVEAGFDIELLFDDGDEYIDGDCDPDLCLDSVLGGADVSFPVKLLVLN